MKLINKNGVDFTILPVIHSISDDHDLLNYGLEKIEDLLGGPPGLVGIGSLVPLLKSMEKNGMERFLYALISLRKILPDSFIHAFGIGGTMAYLAVLSGIDSYDSNGWIQKTAYGVIQLPGTSDRYLKKENHNRSYLIKERKLKHSKKIINEVGMFMNCSCEACQPYNPESWKEKDWKLKQKDFTGRSQEAKLLRGIHNVSLYQNELFMIREAIKNERLVELIKNRLENSIFYKYISFVEKLKEENIENLGLLKISSMKY